MIERLPEDTWRVYGVRKVWRQLDRGRLAVARCTVARPMKRMGIQDITRGKPQKGDSRPYARRNHGMVDRGNQCTDGGGHRGRR
ncbi:IS3 family transposase [Sagittula sp. M10.9X]|uniref:IS3 family transposase n=1 Tax=Sagittula salina TaxID=2820268 RepID=A0A940S5K8_9RHOB|nr:IS3 family transposase [Sagittula salina]